MLKHNSVLLQVQVVGMNDNFLQGGLPDSWSNLTHVSP